MANNKKEVKDVEVTEVIEETVQPEKVQPEVKQKGLKSWFKKNWKKVAGGAAIAGGIATIAALGMRKHNSAADATDSDMSQEEAIEILRKYLEEGEERINEQLSIAETSEASETTV